MFLKMKWVRIQPQESILNLDRLMEEDVKKAQSCLAGDCNTSIKQNLKSWGTL